MSQFEFKRYDQIEANKVKETWIIIDPHDVVNLLAVCADRNKDVAIYVDADFTKDLKCAYCCRPGFASAFDDLYRSQRALKILGQTLCIEVRETEY